MKSKAKRIRDAAFRECALRLVGMDQNDIQAEEDAPIDYVEGGAWVTVRIYVYDEDATTSSSGMKP